METAAENGGMGAWDMDPGIRVVYLPTVRPDSIEAFKLELRQGARTMLPNVGFGYATEGLTSMQRSMEIS